MNTQEERDFMGSGQQAENAQGQTAGESRWEAGGQQTQEEQAQGEEAGAASSAQSQALIDELNTLGAKFAEAIDVAWKSEQRKRLEENLRTGVVGVAQSLEQHLKDFSRRDETQRVLDKAENVADKVRSSKVSQEVATALTQGLHALSEQLDKFAKELREREAAKQNDTSETPAADATTPGATGETPPSDTSNQSGGQDIPIERG